MYKAFLFLLGEDMRKVKMFFEKDYIPEDAIFLYQLFEFGEERQLYFSIPCSKQEKNELRIKELLKWSTDLLIEMNEIPNNKFLNGQEKETKWFKNQEKRKDIDKEIEALRKENIDAI